MKQNDAGVTVTFDADNDILYMQDFTFKKGIPDGVEFRVMEGMNEDRVMLIAPGYGEKEDYGCGALFVRRGDIFL